MNTFKCDDAFSEEYTERTERVLSRALDGEVVRRGTYTSDFHCASGKNAGCTIETKFRRKWYGDVLLEIGNTYTDTGSMYEGWFYTQLISDYFAYCIPSENVCLIMLCKELKKISLENRTHFISNSIKNSRPHRTDNIAIPLNEIKSLYSYRAFVF